ncbi:hypothetical protein [Methanospirillum lacunae]
MELPEEIKSNFSERDIRMMKVKIKISGGGFRDRATAEAVPLIRGCISPTWKNGKSIAG